MSKSLSFLCNECGDTFPKWTGKCSSCGTWNSIVEFKSAATVDGKKISAGTDLLAIEKEQVSESPDLKIRISTKIEEVDRVLGDGFFPGSLVLFGGSPGIGKSTLSLQIFSQINGALYFSGEESRDQVASRAERIVEDSGKRLEHKNCSIVRNVFATNSLEDICETIQKHSPPFAIVDSIQMIGRSGGGLGQISQIRENAEVLLKLSKTTGTTILLIGHVTKSDEIAGPRILEHLVDTVLYLEGEKNSEIRILRAVKNRFGSTQEVGVFEMLESGLKELKNPSAFFLTERAENAFGSSISVVREGNRNFLMEIQALTVKTNFGLPRRTSHGIDLSKLHLLLAVISKFTPFACDALDAYINVIGGLKIKEPAADLAICAAILSSCAEREIPADTIILGEVGLSGEVRHIGGLEARLVEAEKLGFKKAIVPKLPAKKFVSRDMKIVEIRSVAALMKELFEVNKK